MSRNTFQKNKREQSIAVFILILAVGVGCKDSDIDLALSRIAKLVGIILMLYILVKVKSLHRKVNSQVDALFGRANGILDTVEQRVETADTVTDNIQRIADAGEAIARSPLGYLVGIRMPER